MGNKRQSEFPNASTLDGSETFGLIQSGVNKKSLLSAIKTFILGGYTPVFVLAKSSVAVATSAITTEETLATITIPAGLLGMNGQVVVTALWSCTNSANDKTFRVKLGGTGGTSYLENVVTTAATLYTCTAIRNRTASSQIGFDASATSFGASTSAIVTSAVNTTASTTLVLTGQKELDTESLTLESYSIEIIK